jgi:osmotically inducible lipoprotein OsmB
MKRTTSWMLIGLLPMLAACSDMTPQQQRMLSGGAIGAAGGAAIGAISGGSPAAGAVIGGAAGAAVGAITTPRSGYRHY